MSTLKDLRKQKSLTQKYLAKAVGVAPKTVSQWEMGVNRPSPEHFRALEKALGCSAKDLQEALSLARQQGNWH